MWYRIYLTATDAAGISRTVLRDVLPVKSAITLDTVPPGLAVLLDGAEVSAPFVFVGVAGIERVLEARSQMANGVAYEFESWSDGGAATHTIGTPGRDATLVARFRALAPEADAAEFVSQSVTNEMVGGAPYPVTVVLRNTGTTTWTTAGNYFLASQNPPDSTTWDSRVWRWRGRCRRARWRRLISRSRRRGRWGRTTCSGRWCATAFITLAR